MVGRIPALFKSVADGVAAVIGAALFSQLPEFVQQYLQRLGGHRDEALRFLEMLKTQGSENSSGLVAATKARADWLVEAWQSVAGAGEFGRPLVFLRHFDAEIAGATWDAFRPAVPLTPQGIAYASIGLIAGVALLHFVAAPIGWLWRWLVRA